MISAKKDKNQQIQVFVRVRPLNKQEGSANIVEFNAKNNKELNVKHHGHTKTYTFDRVFPPNSKQIDVYKLVAEPTVAEVIAGYNCTVLAYGQTGTGKTYTMAGGNPDIVNVVPSPVSKTPWMEDVHAGLIPRTLAHLFDELRVQQIEFTVRVSYLELYNEEIFDLLSPLEDYTKLKLYDDSIKKGSIIVQGLTETTINTKADVYKILEKGAEKRRIASTLMNSQSSRSHTVFCITVHTKENSIEGEDLLKTGKLYLVDLAGSENIKQSGATDIRAREAFNINQSLLTLGRCINKLTERATHIPYRESKLTRLLQDSLGGRTKTTLIATVSPAYCNADETLNTLDYAFRAKSITNKPEINQRLSKKTLLKDYTEEIERLRKDLMATKRGTGIYLDEENYNTLTEQRETHKAEIAEKINIIRMLEEEMNRKEQLCNDLKISLEEHQKTVEIKEIKINKLETKLDDASKKITNLHEENEIKEFFVQKLSETEESLKSTAKELITVADTTTSDAKKLHDKLDALGDITKYNKMICEQQMSEFNVKIDGVSDDLRRLQDHQYTLLENVNESMKTVRKTLETYNNITETQNTKLVSFVNDTNNITNDLSSDNVESIERLKEIQSLVLQNAEDQTANLRDDYESKVVATQNAIIKYVEDQNILISNILKSTEDMLQQNSLQVTTYINNALKELEDTKILMKNRMEKMITMCADAQRKTIDANKREREKQKNLMQKLQEYQIAANEYYQESIENDEQYLEYLKSIELYENKNKSKFEEKLDKSNVLTNHFITAISSTEEQNTNILTRCKTKETQLNSKLDSTQSQLLNVLEEFSMSAYQSCNEISNTCTTKLNEQISLETGHYERTTNAMNELSGALSTEIQVLRARNEDLSQNINSNVDKVMTSSNLFEEKSSNLESSMATGLDTCREGFRKLYTSSLKEYKQTGQTPQRRFYKYPRTLTETKPKEKLIEEYHKVRSSSATRAAVDEVEQIDKTSGIPKHIRSSSESSIPRILKDSDENRGRDVTKHLNNKDHRRQLSGDENSQNISSDSYL